MGLTLRRQKSETIDPALESARRERLAARLHSVSKRSAADTGRIGGEFRDSRRQSAYRVGSAMFEPGHETSCRVDDHSYSGLRLEMLSSAPCPDEFALTIPTLRFIGIVRRAWQNERQVGVAILRWRDAA